MLKVGQAKEIYEMKGAGRSIRGIADDLGIARNTVRRYLNSPEALRPKRQPRQVSELDSYTEYVDRRLDEGLDNCVVLHRELKVLGYGGGYSILKSYMSPRRRRRQPEPNGGRLPGSLQSPVRRPVVLSGGNPDSGVSLWKPCPAPLFASSLPPWPPCSRRSPSGNPASPGTVPCG